MSCYSFVAAVTNLVDNQTTRGLFLVTVVHSVFDL